MRLLWEFTFAQNLSSSLGLRYKLQKLGESEKLYLFIGEGITLTEITFCGFLVLFSLILQVDFTYPHDFPFVPDNFTNSRRRIAFNQTTYDPLFAESSPSHIIYKYVCDDTHRCHYREASRLGGILQWILSVTTTSIINRITCDFFSNVF